MLRKAKRVAHPCSTAYWNIKKETSLSNYGSREPDVLLVRQEKSRVLFHEQGNNKMHKIAYIIKRKISIKILFKNKV